MDNTRASLDFPMFDEDDTEEVNSILKELSRSSSPTNFSFSSLYRLTKWRLVSRMMAKDFHILLPSDQSWRLKNYFKLLHKQKEKTLILHVMPPDEEEDDAPKWEQVVISQPETKRAKTSIPSSVTAEGSVISSQVSDLSWNSLDLVKAAALLGSTAHEVSFRDEEEMRRVFALVYDVFRYKSILNEALRETGFLTKYPQHKDNVSLIWLLFYDLHKRRFLPRSHIESIISSEVFEECGLMEIERDLWTSRIKLAASLARARIKNNALRLNQLLPPHLRDERFVCTDETPVTGWINTFQKSKKEICDSIESMGFNLQSKHETVLTKNDFRFDHLCPKLLLCHPVQRPELAQSSLVKNHTIVLQDRAFCIGPALLGKILMDIPLRGTVAQTHVNTPRTTAYLANVLVENDRLDKLVAFGAGDRLLEYQTYIHELGVTNCEIYAQKFADIHPEAAILENLVAVLATPPNSCTGVTDPVDLICSRGGDIDMLKALTELEMGKNAMGHLEEQRNTLKYCMSLPQVQIILYETHSLVPEENFEMVNNVIESVNQLARDKHEEEHRLALEREEAEEKLNKPVFIPGKSLSREQREREAQEAKEAKEAAEPKEVEVPPCDLFEVVSLPDLCKHGPDGFTEEGCFLARIQRKEIISLDAKYMIKIAEARGLFGVDLAKKKVAAPRVAKKQERRRTSVVKIKVKRAKVYADDLSATSGDRRNSSAPDQRDGVLRSGDAEGVRRSVHGDPRSGSTSHGQSQPQEETRRGAMWFDAYQRSKRSQDESARRLSRPIRRESSGVQSFMSEVKPRFWRYATAKSIEDLIRLLRKKRRGKRIFKVEDYFFFKDQGILFSDNPRKSLTSQTGQLLKEDFGISNVEANILKAHSAKSKGSVASKDTTFITDIEVIKPYINKDVLRITSYGAMSDRSVSKSTSNTMSMANLSERNNSSVIQQCMDNATEIFQKIDEVIEENKKLAEMKIKTIVEKKEDPFNQKHKFKNKSFSPLEALSKIEEISNIIDFKKSHKTDLILPDKYLPGTRVSEQQREFVKTLQKKLEKLQQSYQHWTRWQEAYSAERLSIPKKPTTIYHQLT